MSPSCEIGAMSRISWVKLELGYHLGSHPNWMTSKVKDKLIRLMMATWISAVWWPGSLTKAIRQPASLKRHRNEELSNDSRRWRLAQSALNTTSGNTHFSAFGARVYKTGSILARPKTRFPRLSPLSPHKSAPSDRHGDLGQFPKLSTAKIIIFIKCDDECTNTRWRLY